jgi:hypothetical protein
MEIQKFNVKLFVESPSALPLTDFIEVFHAWIQASDGIYHDVADYSHMQAGPGIVLIANHANVSIDESENRRGLLYSQKSLLGGSNLDRLRALMRSALENFRKLEHEPKLRGEFKLVGNEATIAVNDRLVWPNTVQSYNALAPEIERLSETLFCGAEVTLERERDERKKLAVRIKASRSFAVDELLGRLQ